MQELKNLIVKTELVDWRLLKPFQPDSLKKTTEERLEKLENSLLANGFAMSFYIFQDANGSYWVIDGHHRLKALNGLEKKGYDVPTHFPCAFLNVENETHAKKLVLAFNSHYAELTKEGVEEFIEGLNLDDLNNEFELFELGFKLPEIKVEEEFADDLPEDPPAITQEGDLYEISSGENYHKILCADSRDFVKVGILMDGKKADMVFSDPPYEMKLDADYSDLTFNGRIGKKYNNVIGDHEDFTPELIKTVFDNFDYCKEIFLWGPDYYVELIPGFKSGCLIVWDKTLESNGNAGSGSEFELCWSKQKHKRQVIKFNWFRFFGLSKQDIKKRIHPTQKPIQVITAILNKYLKGKIVVDLYLGSGSTLIACEQTERDCYGIELDPAYVDLIIQRFVDYKLKKQENFKILKNKKDITNEFLK